MIFHYLKMLVAIAIMLLFAYKLKSEIEKGYFAEPMMIIVFAAGILVGVFGYLKQVL